MRVFLRDLLDTFNNMSDLAGPVPREVVFVLAVLLCWGATQPQALIRLIGKIWDLLGTPSAGRVLLGCFALASFVGFAYWRAHVPKVADPFANRTDRSNPGAPQTEGTGDLHHSFDHNELRLRLDQGRVEAEIPDASSSVLGRPERSAYRLLFGDVGTATELAASGFNASTKDRTRRIRARLYRDDVGSSRWCLEAWVTDSSKSGKKQTLKFDNTLEAGAGECWDGLVRPNSISLRLDYDGERLRARVEFLKTTASPLGRVTPPEDLSRSRDIEYPLNATDATKLVAAIGSAEVDQPKWRIWVVSDYWNVIITRGQK